ncbi:hypothetical protein B0H11DRAFT_2197394 [Mycena galericulata]|nr:hypothetical protein B0H11DRAFT_2197394 [Mycena galericulata]
MQNFSDCPMSLSRPLKRSASVASLPTPPRTPHKRKRTRSKHILNIDDQLTATGDDDEKLIKEAEDDESFWLTTNPTSTTFQHASPPLLHRQSQTEGKTQVLGVAPLPPLLLASHRKPHRQATAKSTSSTVSPPSTPKRYNGALPFSRDSPDNPFLSSPLGSQYEVVVNESEPLPNSQEEKPTMAFVFRGVRLSFPNPYYSATSSCRNPNSDLPPEHPDFEPEEHGVRKLLFGARSKNGVAKTQRNRRAGAGTIGPSTG